MKKILISAVEVNIGHKVCFFVTRAYKANKTNTLTVTKTDIGFCYHTPFFVTH